MPILLNSRLGYDFVLLARPDLAWSPYRHRHSTYFTLAMHTLAPKAHLLETPSGGPHARNLCMHAGVAGAIAHGKYHKGLRLLFPTLAFRFQNLPVTHLAFGRPRHHILSWDNCPHLEAKLVLAPRRQAN